MTAIDMPHMSATSARESVERARTHLEAAAEEVVRQINGRAWLALGYESWDEMREAEYRGAAVIVPRADRPELVARLRAEGLSQRQIGDTIGTSQQQVSNDLRNTKLGNTAPTRTDALGRERPTTYTPRARDLPQADPPAVEDSAVPAPSVTADVAEFPDLAYYRDKGDDATVARIATALRGYDANERARRLENLRKTIAAEQRRDEQPEPEAGEPDYAAMADAMFTACNKAMSVIAANGDSVTVAEAVATSDPLMSDNWRGQFEQLAHACQRMADACKPRLRRVK